MPDNIDGTWQSQRNGAGDTLVDSEYDDSDDFLDDLIEEDDDDEGLRIYLPLVNSEAGTRVTWEEFDLGVPSQAIDRTLGGFIRSRLGILDEKVREMLMTDRQRQNVRDRYGVVALGAKFGLDLRPGDDEVRFRLTADELKPESAIKHRPREGQRWLIEQGMAGFPRFYDQDGQYRDKPYRLYLDGIVPLTGYFIKPFGSSLVLEDIDLMDIYDMFEMLENEADGAAGGMLVIVPQERGYFVRMQVPIQVMEEGRVEDAEPTEVVLFMSDETEIEVGISFAYAATARYLFARTELDSESYRYPAPLVTDEVRVLEHGSEWSHLATQDSSHQKRTLNDLSRRLAEFQEGMIRLSDDQSLRIIEEQARLAREGESFEVEFPEAGMLMCLPSGLGIAA